MMCVFSVRSCCKHFWHGQQHPLLDTACPGFPLPTPVMPVLQDVRKDFLFERLLYWCVTCPNRLGFQLLTVTCQVSIAHKDADPALHQVNDHMPLGDMQMFLQNICWCPSNAPNNPIM